MHIERSENPGQRVITWIGGESIYDETECFFKNGNFLFSFDLLEWFNWSKPKNFPLVQKDVRKKIRKRNMQKEKESCKKSYQFLKKQK
jgi:hypothetical protein